MPTGEQPSFEQPPSSEEPPSQKETLEPAVEGESSREEGEQKEPTPTEEYEDSLEAIHRLDEKIEDSTEQAEEDREDMAELRGSMDLPPDPDPGFETATDKYVAGLEEQRTEAEQEIKDEERALLDVPEGEGSNPESLNKPIDAVAEKREEDIEKMQKEGREKFIKEFIDSSVKKVTDAFEGFLDESKNADQARQLIKQKITAEVSNKAEGFIEDGGEPDIGFVAELKVAEFDGAKGEKVKHVTEFDITFEGEASAAQSNKEDEEELVGRQAEEQMKEAEKQGGLEETEKAA